jgi:GcrA cell cycle regulator
MTWTEERVEKLRELHARQLSCAMMAGELGGGISRNAVIGKLHRLGLSNAYSTVHKENRRPRKTRDKTNRKTIRIVKANGNSRQMRLMESPETDLQALRCVEVVPRNISLLDLEPGECRYPYGDSNFTFCGHPSAEGYSYCAPHAVLSWTETRNMSEAGREKRRRTLRANFKIPLMDAAE